jgi:hypothetical protein
VRASLHRYCPAAPVAPQGCPRDARRSRGLDPPRALPGLAAMDRRQGIVGLSPYGRSPSCATIGSRRSLVNAPVGTSSVPRMHTDRYPSRRRRFQRPISYRELAAETLGAVWLEVAVCRPSFGARLAV